MDPSAPGDSDIHAWILRHRSSVLTAAALAVTATGTGVVAYAMAVLVGLTRFYLGVHWPTDVLVGRLLAALATAAALPARHRPITPAARRSIHGQWTSTAHEADA